MKANKYHYLIMIVLYEKSKDYSNGIIILIHCKNLYDNGTISSI